MALWKQTIYLGCGVVYPMIALRESPFCGKMKKSNYTVKFAKATMRRVTISEKERSIAGSHAKMCSSGANSVSSKIEERTQDESIKRERCARRDAGELAKGCLQAQEQVKRYVLLSCRRLGNAGTLFEKARRATFRDRLWSFNEYVK